MLLLIPWCHHHTRWSRWSRKGATGFALVVLLWWVLPLHSAPEAPQLRVMTYNVAGGLVHQRHPMAVMLQQQPDIVLLQEVSNAEHLAWLGRNLQLAYSHMATYRNKRGGVAVLSRWPLGAAHTHLLGTSAVGRVALATQVASPAGPLWVCSVHLDNPLFLAGPLPTFRQQMQLIWRELFTTTPRTREAQELYAWLLHLSGEDWIIGGDFNTLPFSSTDRTLRRTWHDALARYPWRYVLGTYWNLPHVPFRPRIDFLYHSATWDVVDAQVIQQKASDHFPVLGVFTPHRQEQGSGLEEHAPTGQRSLLALSGVPLGLRPSAHADAL